MTTSRKVSVWPVVPKAKKIVCSPIVSSTAEITVSGRLSIRARTAAASARSSRSGPWIAPSWNPRIGARRIAVTAESKPAIPQTTSETRFTRHPSRRARSSFSAAARAPTP